MKCLLIFLLLIDLSLRADSVKMWSNKKMAISKRIRNHYNLWFYASSNNESDTITATLQLTTWFRDFECNICFNQDETSSGELRNID